MKKVHATTLALVLLGIAYTALPQAELELSPVQARTPAAQMPLLYDREQPVQDLLLPRPAGPLCPRVPPGCCVFEWSGPCAVCVEQGPC